MLTHVAIADQEVVVDLEDASTDEEEANERLSDTAPTAVFGIPVARDSL